MTGISTTCKALEYINRLANASSDEDVDFLIQLMQPTDNQEEMGHVYMDTLGYNPIEYFDRRKLETAYSTIMDVAPDSLKSDLNTVKPGIIEHVIAMKAHLNDDYLLYMLLSEISAETGWTDKDLSINFPDIMNAELNDGFEVNSDEIFDDEEDDDDEDMESDTDDDEYAFAAND